MKHIELDDAGVSFPFVEMDSDQCGSDSISFPCHCGESVEVDNEWRGESGYGLLVYPEVHKCSNGHRLLVFKYSYGG